VGWLVISGYLSWPLLVVVFAIPKLIASIKVFSKPRPAEKPDNELAVGWPLYLVHQAFVYNRQFGMLFLLGLIADVIIR
jgi:1,4-dihydroxy-2-naphthoate octaprenyltransferase